MELPKFPKFVFIIHGLQVTMLNFGLVVIVPAGTLIDAGVPLPYCISRKRLSTNANRSFVVTVGAGSSIERLNPFP